MPNIILSPWRGGTPRRLAKALGLILRTPDMMREDIERYESLKNKKLVHLKPIKTIVNWGCSCPTPMGDKVLNRAPAVAAASNKLRTFKILHEKKIPTLEYTKERKIAEEWHQNHSVIAHVDVHGHSGSGLVLWKKEDTSKCPEAQVYTKYFPKKTECRIHVIRTADGFKHMYLEKRRIRKERYADFGLTDTPDTYIRTYENGWIFARQVEEDVTAVALAKITMSTLLLDYAAVDILKRNNQYLIGEVNTAPGLEGESLQFYIDHLKTMI